MWHNESIIWRIIESTKIYYKVKQGRLSKFTVTTLRTMYWTLQHFTAQWLEANATASCRVWRNAQIPTGIIRSNRWTVGKTIQRVWSIYQTLCADCFTQRTKPMFPATPWQTLAAPGSSGPLVWWKPVCFCSAEPVLSGAATLTLS